MKAEVTSSDGLVKALFDSDDLNPREFRMSAPKVETRAIGSDGCIGRTNIDDGCVILVSSAINPKVDKGPECYEAHQYYTKREAVLLAGFLRRTGNFDGHPIGRVYVIHPANADDLFAALHDCKISSIAVIGHTSRGSWKASDEDVDWMDITYHLDPKRGHCKTGFGLVTGCDTVKGYEDRRYFLSPVYGHPNHEGGLYVMKGSPYHGRDAVPNSGSMISRGLNTRPRIVRLVPS